MDEWRIINSEIKNEELEKKMNTVFLEKNLYFLFKHIFYFKNI
jgi:hypothetical protein